MPALLTSRPRQKGWRLLLRKVATVAIFAGILVASVHAESPEEGVAMTKEEKALAERIIANQKKRLEGFRITHIKAESHRTEEKDGDRISQPMPSKIEVWWDTSRKSYRIEFRPRIYTDSITRFSIGDAIEISNGKESMRVNDRGKYRPSIDRPDLDLLNLSKTEDLVQTLSRLTNGHPMKDTHGEHLLRPIQWEEKEAVEYIERTLKNGELFKEERIILSPEEDDLIRYSRISRPAFSKTGSFEQTVHAAKRASNGIFYASDYTETGRYEGTSTTTHFSIRSLELLERFPDELLAPLTSQQLQ